MSRVAVNFVYKLVHDGREGVGVGSGWMAVMLVALMKGGLEEIVWGLRGWPLHLHLSCTEGGRVGLEGVHISVSTYTNTTLE